MIGSRRAVPARAGLARPEGTAIGRTGSASTMDTAGKTGIRAEVLALKRERTLAAAVDLFYDSGYKNTTLDALAERLGVTKPLICAHFGSKSELLAEICARGILRSLDAMNSVGSLHISAKERLDFWPGGSSSRCLRHRSSSRSSRARRRTSRLRTSPALTRCGATSTGSLPPCCGRAWPTASSTLPTRTLPRWRSAEWGAGAYVWCRPSGRLELDQLAERMAGLILLMVGAAPSRAGGRGPAETISA